MTPRATLLRLALPAALVAACGGKVVVDLPGGGGGAGGSSSTTTGSTSSTSGASSSGVVSSSSSSSTSASSATSATGGLVTLCFQGFNAACQPCKNQATEPGGPCAAAYQKCVSSMGGCGDFGSCSGGCGGDQGCCDKCADAFPFGAEAYGGVVACIACNACPDDCGDAVQPGFCP